MPCVKFCWHFTVSVSSMKAGLTQKNTQLRSCSTNETKQIESQIQDKTALFSETKSSDNRTKREWVSVSDNGSHWSIERKHLSWTLIYYARTPAFSETEQKNTLPQISWNATQIENFPANRRLERRRKKKQGLFMLSFLLTSQQCSV